MKDKKAVYEDLVRWGAEPSEWGLHKLMTQSKTFRTLFATRVSFESQGKKRLIKFLYKPSDNFGMDVETKELGGGMLICHGNSSIVYAYRIGKNFLVHQNVTLGRGKENCGRFTPIIGDNVFVGTGAIIIGGITIGNNVKIGAGSLVNKDVPDNCTVVGNPMRILSKKDFE